MTPSENPIYPINWHDDDDDDEEEDEEDGLYMTDAEYTELHSKKKKATVFFHKSDFRTLDEYIDYMRRPPISDEEVENVAWNEFLVKLSKWEGIK